MAHEQQIKKGDRVAFKPEWRDAGDGNTVFRAIEDEVQDPEYGNSVLVEAEVDLPIRPTQVVAIRMIEGR